MRPDPTEPAWLADRSWIDVGQTRRLVAALDRAAIDFRFVGGAVRDGLLGRKVTDIDIATPVPPDAVGDRLTQLGIKIVPTGIAHGTVTAVVDGRPFEITTLRRDLETDGRRAKVAFTDDWQADAARRDFTMNALYADRDGAVTDFFGGAADALAGRVRFIGDPAARIAEDALRILRFFRFHAHYGSGPPDPAGLDAATLEAAMLSRLSGERVRDELMKLLRAPYPVPICRTMIERGILTRILPGMAEPDALARLVSIEGWLGLPADPVRRLAALVGVRSAADIVALKARLKFSNRDMARLRAMAEPAPQLSLVVQGSFGRALYDYPLTAADLPDAALLEHVRSGKPDLSTLQDFLAFAVSWQKPRLPVQGADIVARGVAPGPAVSAQLAEIESWWVQSGFERSRAECLTELDRMIAATRPPPAAAT